MVHIHAKYTKSKFERKATFKLLIGMRAKARREVYT